MRVLTVVHQPDAGPGVFGEAAAAAGHEVVEWLPPEGSAPPDGFDAAMVFGGAMDVDQEAAHPWLRPEKDFLRGLLERSVPTLAVCLGAQLLAEAAGGSPRRASEPEIGWYPVDLTEQAAEDPVLGALPRRFEAFQWHSYEVPLPPGGVRLARSPVCLQAYRLEGPAWGIQFHAEVSADSAERWLDGYAKDEDAVRIGLDVEGVRAQTRHRIAAWNELGRAFAGRFLETATRG